MHQEKININYCPYKWKEIRDQKDKSFCTNCQKQIPDLTRKSTIDVHDAYKKVDCADFHIRHLEEGRGKYHFINRLEGKFYKYGWTRLSAVVLSLYFVVVSCGHKKHIHRKGGKLINNNILQNEQLSDPNFHQNSSSLAQE